MQSRAHSNSISNQPTEDLAPTAKGLSEGSCRVRPRCSPIEGEPEPRSGTLLFLRVPLTSEESKTGCHSRFEHAQEEPYSHRATEVAYSCEARQSHAPHDNAECRVFRQWQSL
jgi:hypothetical protein